MIGRRLGAFTIEALLGTGGMGEVYRARDSTLDRDVAIKVLPAAWVVDAQRRARFDREARILAALNHPHIGAIYGVEDIADLRALVLELVDGPILGERLDAGPMPLREALRIASQIASALDAAHQSGIVHRDLKPANIKIRTDGQVKVLDFGLGKIAGDTDAIPDATRAATAAMATAEGVVMGTAAYMSPEQARGTPLDKRTDIWAFGCILYEMLAGRMAFVAPTWSDTIAMILERDPDWHALPAATPTSVVRLVRRCLEKDVTQRLRDIGDARSEIDELLSSRADARLPELSPRPPTARRSGLLIAAVAVASALLATAATWMLKPASPVAASPLARLTVVLPEDDILASPSVPGLAISPDGRTLAYTARRGARTQLFVRGLDAAGPVAVGDTDGAYSPFFSPDGRWVGFFAQGKLKKVLATGGGLQPLCDAAFGLGGTWSTDGTIYFAPFNTSAIWKVSAAGGTPTEFSRVDRSHGEVSHRWPEVLSDGKTVLFTVWTGPGWDEKHLEVQVGDGTHRRLVRGASTGRYLRSGHLVFSKAETFVVVPFDVSTLQVTGNPVTLRERVREAEAEGAHFGISETGTLVYVPASAGVFERRLVWARRDARSRRLQHRLMDTPIRPSRRTAGSPPSAFKGRCRRCGSTISHDRR